MSVGPAPTELTSANGARVAREQVRLAFGTWIQYVDGRAFSCAMTLLMCGAVPAIGRTPAVIGVLWLSVDFLWSACASVAAQFYFRSEASRTPGFWRAVLVAIWISHAFVWGAALVLFWDPANPANQVVLLTMIMGVMVSYFATLAPCFPVLIAALATISGASWLSVALSGGTLAPVYLALIPTFFLLLANYGREAGIKYRTALRLRFENEGLARELQRASQAKSSFLASMSHELRTPLNAILGYSDLIRERTFGPVTPARYATYIEDIHTSGAHLLKMINDLLDLAKIEAGKREFDFVPLRVADVANDAVTFVGPQAASAHVGVMMNIKHDVLIDADERAAKQMLINLLSNAVKFSRPGGIAVLFCELLGDGRVALGVKDTGVGMTPDLQLRAIEPFAQGSDAYTVEGRGTGLGLPIVKGLIESHQGQLKLESTSGIGSKVWVEFPAERLLRKTMAA